MTPIVITAALIAVVVSVAGFIGLQLRRGSRQATVPNWNGDFDVNRYRPMERLLAEEEMHFLESAGLDRRRLNEVRTERRRLFGRYLRNLESDFSNLHAAARALLVDAPVDRPELAAAIMRQQFDFRVTLLSLRLRLYVPGFSGATATASRLLALAEGMGASTKLARAAVATEA